jgi:uncharacterized protein (TIGR02270 family)
VNQAVCEKAVAQWVDEAALLWLRREHLFGEPHLCLPDLVARDRQLQARLDSLLAVDQIAWRICERELGWEEPGELFPATILAVANNTAQRMPRVLDYALRNYDLARPVASALSWTPLESVVDLLEDWLTSHDTLLGHIALAAAIGHRQVPVSALSQAICAENTALCTRAVRGVGEMGCLELLPQVSELLEDHREEVAYEAAWTCALRGHQERAAEKLWQVVRTGSRQAARAAAVVARVSSVQQSSVRLQRLGDRAPLRRTALFGAAALGSPLLIEWLITWLEFPATARLAGEAISTITGLDLQAGPYFEWNGDPQTGSETAVEESEEAVECDPDEHLPWPRASEINAWWRAHRGEFDPQRRYLHGLELSPLHCHTVLRGGRQRERQFAALELAAGEVSAPLFEVRSPADRQLLQLDYVARQRMESQRHK